jgi:hypothetical protein
MQKTAECRVLTLENNSRSGISHISHIYGHKTTIVTPFYKRLKKEDEG